jgi:Zn-finger nucleic acid-binding protein
MIGDSPYRETPRFLLCPRCAEVLEEAFAGVQSCLRCEGMWIMQPAINGTFGDPRWPLGAAAWWHRALECPECGFEGTQNVMDASIVDGVIIDRCRGHGVWLDPGELARVLGLPSGVNELVALQRLVAPASAVDPAARLAARNSDREAQRRAAESLREIEAANLEAREAARAAREEAAVQAREREARELARIRDHAAKLKQLAAEEAQAARMREGKRQALVGERAVATTELHSIEADVAELRRQLTVAAVKLEAARDRITAIDDQLATPEP